MIIANKPLRVESSEDIAPSSFRIKASRKAFEILSSGLYSDNITAIIRELSTNAADSHIAAGKSDVPFRIHLPTRLEPFFSISDDGVGLSDEQVNGIYTTYFESNKTDNNDVTGCFGLGSKSPFSYTQQFTVVSRFNGKKTTYNCFLNSDGIPAVAKFGEIETDECNGLEISFPVQLKDFGSFVTKAEDVLVWFKVRPIISGVRNFRIDEPVYLFKNDNIGLKCDCKENRVIMGNVAYACDSEKFDKKYLSAPAAKLFACGIDIFLPLGSIDFTANREEIAYTSETTRVISKKLEECVLQLHAYAVDQIKNAKTLWEAQCALAENTHGVLAKINNLISCEWRGKKLHTSVSIVEYNYRKDSTSFKAISISEKLLHGHNATSSQKITKKTESVVYIDKHATYYVNDLENNEGASRIYTDILKKGTMNGGKYCIYFDSCDEEFLKEFGFDEAVIRASNLPKAERHMTTSGRRSLKTKVLKFVPLTRHYLKKNDYWEECEVDLKDGGIYVKVSHSNYTLHNDQSPVIPPWYLSQMISYLGLLGIDVQIYGIRSAHLPMLDKHGGWDSFYNFIRNLLLQNKGLAELYKSVRFKKNAFSLGVLGNGLITFFENHKELFQNSGIIQSFVNSLERVKAFIEKAGFEDPLESANAWEFLARKVDCDKFMEELLQEENELIIWQERIDERYPMLSHSHGDYANKDYIKVLQHYVSLVEDSKL